MQKKVLTIAEQKRRNRESAKSRADALESVANAIEEAVPTVEEAGAACRAAWKHAVRAVRAEAKRVRRGQ